MRVPGIGPIISSAMVAAIGNGGVFSKGYDFGAWLGLVPKQFSTGDRTRHGPRMAAAITIDHAFRLHAAFHESKPATMLEVSCFE